MDSQLLFGEQYIALLLEYSVTKNKSTSENPTASNSEHPGYGPQERDISLYTTYFLALIYVLTHLNYNQITCSRIITSMS